MNDKENSRRNVQGEIKNPRVKKNFEFNETVENKIESDILLLLF